jgi:hypothetical protein
MRVHTVESFRALGTLFARHQRQRMRRILTAIRRAADRAVKIVKKAVPVAFGELREHVHSRAREQGAAVIVNAPHAAPVEVGSRPHTPPLEPIIDWVKLRGMQALLTERQRGRLPGATSKEHAEWVGAELAKHVTAGASDVDAPRRVAFLIQQKIARAGTMPHWYARGSLPEIRRTLDHFVKGALKTKEE